MLNLSCYQVLFILKCINMIGAAAVKKNDADSADVCFGAILNLINNYHFDETNDLRITDLSNKDIGFITSSINVYRGFLVAHDSSDPEIQEVDELINLLEDARN